MKNAIGVLWAIVLITAVATYAYNAYEIAIEGRPIHRWGDATTYLLVSYWGCTLLRDLLKRVMR